MIGNPDFLTSKGQEQVPEFQELESPEGELHLRFLCVSGEEFALPAIGIKEVIEPSPERITAIPNISPLLLGTLNVRGRVIWVADLGQFLGNPAPLTTDRSEIPVIAVEDQDIMLGLAVDEIVCMDWLNVDDVQLSTNTPDSMAPFIKGEWVFGDDSDRALRLLDQVAILRSARWAA